MCKNVVIHGALRFALLTLPHPLPLTPSPIKGEEEPERFILKNIAVYPF
ncbi:hypothetical protein MC7420_1045 [Coleofasciculus chthonoplastes PCC 7420]|uniref:Uncharacterized protein n=1 Tax=Coleofasciculus chthonoplastes PCC 7420 TaxID=118168 RepID=B4W0B6_9CYAN|nr:hypothetical protein MC7420_1045 [Coleofasciculus chthonoplastes PCC 7420]